MKSLHSVTLSVFAKPHEGEDLAALRQALIDLVPLSLEDEKLAVKDEVAKGFNEQPIHILNITISKQAHTNLFIAQMLNRLTSEQKELLVSQKESRLDAELNFFIRLDKDKWLAERAMSITDSGRCFHINMAIAAYPARRPDALLAVEKIFKPD